MPLSYPVDPQTVGEHLKKRRMDLKMLQADVALKFNITEDCVTNWENNYAQPQIKYNPQIIKFLGYCPITFNETTISGKMKSYRWRNGLTNMDLGKRLGVHGTTVLDWENQKRVPPIDKVEIMEFLFAQG